MRKKIFLYILLTALLVSSMLIGGMFHARWSAAPETTFLDLLTELAPFLTITVPVTALLVILLALGISNAIVAPVEALDLDDPMKNDCYEELAPLLKRLDSQQKKLRLQKDDLSRRKDQFEAVTANMSEGLVLLNSGCMILTLNPAARKILGLHRRNIGSDILTYDRRLGFQSLLQQALNGQRAEAVVSLPGGEFQVDASPVINSGTVTGVVLLLFDVTQRARAEQLRREFTANVSHELKTPLQSICGYGELITGGLVPPSEIAPCCERIHSEAQRMIRLVEDILRLSQLDEGASRMEPEQTDLYPMAQRALAEIESVAKQAGIRLSLEGGPTPLRTIPELIEGILTNLCSNAVKYNRPGGTITVTVGQKDGQNFLTVADTGIGISPEHHSRIFERFYRVDKSRSKEVGGTGLGLSIVKHSVQILGGRIELRSAPDQGTTVTVWLPG